MKINLRKLLLLGAAAGLLFTGIAACGENRDVGSDHEHVYLSWEIITPATCETPGEERGVCSCGYAITRQIDATGHSWDDGVVTVEPDCVTAGVRHYTCQNEGCGKTNNEPIGALGHDWQAVSVVRDATCTEAGLRSAVCKRCGAQEQEQEIPALGHDFKAGDKIIKAPTCTETGKREATCNRCGAPGEVDIPARGHSWAEELTEIIKPATCDQDGEQKLVCRICNEEETKPIPQLGHSWDYSYTIDREPTFSEEGEKSIHCSRCDVTRDVTPIPKLEEGKKSEYEFRLVRNNGTRLTETGVKVTVRAADGSVASEGTTRGGSYRAELVPAAYTVTLSDLPDGYTAQASYALSAGNTLCKMALTGSVIATPASEDVKYGVGSAMHDFTFTAIDGSKVSLSALLAQKKIVVLNFWATWCGPCQSEFPTLVSLYAEFGSEIEILAINSSSTGDTTDRIRTFAQDYELTFPVIKDETENLFGKFGTGSYPTTVIIDCEGVVCHIQDYPSSEAQFRNLFERYTNPPYWHEAALPVKRED